MKGEGMGSSRKSFVYESWAVEVVVLAKEYCTQFPRLLKEGDRGALSGWLFPFLPLLYYKMARVDARAALSAEPYVSFDTHEGAVARMAARFDEVWGSVVESMELDLSGHQVQVGQSLSGLYYELYNMLVHFQDGLEERMEGAFSYLVEAFYQWWGVELLRVMGVLHEDVVSGFEYDDDAQDSGSLYD